MAGALSDIDGVSVRLGADDEFFAQDAAGAGLVDDEHRLGAVLRPELLHGPGREIAGAAGGKGDDDLDRLGRVILGAEA